MAIDKRTITIVAASTAIGFLGDVLIYSMGESKGKKFRIVIPKGAEAIKLLALGVGTGVIIDYAIKAVEVASMNAQERNLTELYQIERKRIAEGEREGLRPVQILWDKLIR